MRPDRDRPRPCDTERVLDDGRYAFEGREAGARRAPRLLGGTRRAVPDRRRSRTAPPKTTGTGWKQLTERLGDRVQLVGDDLFVTNVERLDQGIEEGVANSILIKVNQIGTLTETLDTIALARSHGYGVGHVTSLGRDRGHDDRRSRRGHQFGQIKTGAPSRSDRVAKYNQLLRIEEELGAEAAYPGWDAFPRFSR